MTLNILIGCASKTTDKTVDILKAMHALSECVGELHLNLILIDNVSSDTKTVLEKLCDNIYTDEDEWTQWKVRGDPVLHIDLTKWADIFVLAPLDMNTLAKIALGLCDNLLTCTVRAWNRTKPLLYCPSINHKFIRQELTQSHLRILQSWGYKHLLPIYSEGNDDNTIEYPVADPTEIAETVLKLCLNRCIRYLLED